MNALTSFGEFSAAPAPAPAPAKTKAPAPRVIRHGTIRGYVTHGCRCDVCRTVEMERQRRYRARMKAGEVARRPNDPNAVPVMVRGTLYPSIAAAAQALGVMPSTISGHLRRHGHCDFVGLGQKSPAHNRDAHRTAPISIHGRRFPSIKAASDYLGVPYGWLYKAIRTGRPANAGDRILAALMRADAQTEGRA